MIWRGQPRGIGKPFGPPLLALHEPHRPQRISQNLRQGRRCTRRWLVLPESLVKGSGRRQQRGRFHARRQEAGDERRTVPYGGDRTRRTFIGHQQSRLGKGD